MIAAPVFSRIIRPHYRVKVLEPEDAPALFEAIADNRPVLHRWLPWVESTRSVLDSRAFIEDNLKKYTRGENVTTGIWHRQTLVGCVGLNEIHYGHRRTAIGYWLAQRYQGNGIMTDACRLLIEYAFDELDMNRIEILCAVQNLKSRAVAQRLQFTHEGTLRDYLRLYDAYSDMALYSLLRKDWQRYNEDYGVV